MNSSLMPSLEHMALVKIVTTLWNHKDIRALFENFYSIKDDAEEMELRRNAEYNVTEKILLLQQPGPTLIEKILGAVKPIGFQMFSWVDYNRETYDFTINFQDQFHWTPMGTVDKKKMAEALMRGQGTLIRQYKVACVYCLENDAEELWKNMPEDCRRRFCMEECLGEVEKHRWQFFWARDDNNEAFMRAADYFNEVAAKYFWNKLTPEERLELIVRMPDWYPPEPGLEIGVFFSLIPLMDDQQQLKMLENYTDEMIVPFIDWPSQNSCMEVVNRVWNFVSVDGYCLLLEYVIYKIQSGYKDCNYRELFKQLWVQSPETHKSYVINHYAAEYLVGYLLEIRDAKNISLIFKYATLAERKNILFHCNIIHICKNLVYSNQWDLLKFFITECASSGEEIKVFKDKYKETSEMKNGIPYAMVVLDNERSLFDFWATPSSQEKQMLDEIFLKFLNDLVQNCYKNRGTKRNRALRG